MSFINRYMTWRRERAESREGRELVRYQGLSARLEDGIFQLVEQPKITARALRALVEEKPGGTRRLANLVNQLFDSIPNPYTGRPATNDDLAGWSRQGEEHQGIPALPLENIEAMRDGTPISFSESDLLQFCDFFGVDYSYFTDTITPFGKLDPQVAEARLWRAEHPDWSSSRFFLEDLRSWMEDQRLSVEEVARETGAIHPEHLRAVLDGRSHPPYDFEHAVGEAMGFPHHVARERWMGRWVANDLVP